MLNVLGRGKLPSLAPTFLLTKSVLLDSGAWLGLSGAAQKAGFQSLGPVGLSGALQKTHLSQLSWDIFAWLHVLGLGKKPPWLEPTFLRHLCLANTWFCRMSSSLNCGPPAPLKQCASQGQPTKLTWTPISFKSKWKAEALRGSKITSSHRWSDRPPKT